MTRRRSRGGLFGTAVATMGMLSTAGYILAMDMFGPITDNAGGIVEMSQQPERSATRPTASTPSGNTTKALTKGYAIGSAALAAFLLFSAYLDEVRNLHRRRRCTVEPRASRRCSSPALLGAHAGVLVLVARDDARCRKAAQSVITEVRRQFKEKPGIMLGTEEPDYAACVDIVTVGALKAMVLPGALVLAVPDRRRPRVQAAWRPMLAPRRSPDC